MSRGRRSRDVVNTRDVVVVVVVVVESKEQKGPRSRDDEMDPRAQVFEISSVGGGFEEKRREEGSWKLELMIMMIRE